MGHSSLLSLTHPQTHLHESFLKKLLCTLLIESSEDRINFNERQMQTHLQSNTRWVPFLTFPFCSVHGFPRLALLFCLCELGTCFHAFCCCFVCPPLRAGCGVLADHLLKLQLAEVLWETAFQMNACSSYAHTFLHTSLINFRR